MNIVTALSPERHDALAPALVAAGHTVVARLLGASALVETLCGTVGRPGASPSGWPHGPAGVAEQLAKQPEHPRAGDTIQIPTPDRRDHVVVLAEATPRYLTIPVVSLCDDLAIRLVVIAGDTRQVGYARRIGIWPIQLGRADPNYATVLRCVQHGPALFDGREASTAYRRDGRTAAVVGRESGRER